MKKQAKVKELISCYNKGNLKKVHEYLSDPDLQIKYDSSDGSWAYEIKLLLDKKQYETAKQIIELVAYKFKFLNIK